MVYQSRLLSILVPGQQHSQALADHSPDIVQDLTRTTLRSLVRRPVSYPLHAAQHDSE